MTGIRNIVFNFCFFFCARCLEMISSIVVVGMLARYLGLSDFGEYSLVMAVIWTVQPAINMSIPRILTVELSRDISKTVNYVGTGMSWNIWICTLLLMAVWVARSFGLDLPSYYFAGIVFALFLTLTQAVTSVFVAFQQIQYELYTTISSVFSLLLLTGGVIYLDLGLENVFLASAVSSVFAFFAAMLLNRRLSGLVLIPKMDFTILRYLLIVSLFYSMIQGLTQLSLYGGVFVLKILSGNIEVALFQAPMRIFTRLLVIPFSLIVALLPLLSRLAELPEKKDEMKKTAQTLMKLLMVMSMMMTITVFATAEELVGLIFGRAFYESINGLQHIVMGSLFLFINQFFIILFVICNRAKQGITLKILEFILCMVLNFLLVPKYGHLGSVWALILSSGLSSFGGFFVFPDLFEKDTFRHMSVIVISGGFIVAGLEGLSHIHAVVLFLSGMVCFTMAMLISGTVRWDELAPVMEVVNRRLGRAFSKKIS